MYSSVWFCEKICNTAICIIYFAEKKINDIYFCLLGREVKEEEGGVIKRKFHKITEANKHG